MTEVLHSLLSFPMWVFFALLAATVAAWRSSRPSRRRWRVPLLAVAVTFYLLSMPAVPGALELWLESRYPVPVVTENDRSPDNVVIVLTAGWLRSTQTGFEQKLGEAGWERTIAAVALWRKVGGRILFTGAPTPDGRDSAAASMARLAHALGVPSEALLVEPASLNTHENLLFAKRLLGPGPQRLWLLTSAFHLPRAVAAAKAVGLDVKPYPCDFRADERWDWDIALPGNSSRAALERSLHEIGGMAIYRLRGWN